ncbi:hypothetical protein EJ03DRAFT_372772 [Teratosphaeria nubilosa]|uniref:Rhodopsin domain-containing protein n=1 Tax=Teratosphaeria nubilosa TaxID=161662 RepID=A0A6G1LG62_9PEZI|nr:hypothetical protein EJ03DRAFT_372772 [Teratosphaeria nubilosa]
MHFPGNSAPSATISAILFLTWAFLTFAVRLCTKYGKRDKWGHDDTAMTLAFLLGAGNVAALCYAISLGFGNPWSTFTPSDETACEKALYVASIFYVVAMGFTRMSASLFAERLLSQDRMTAMGHAPLAAYSVWTFAATMAVALRGDVENPWDTRIGSRDLYVRYICYEVSGVVLDVAIVSLAIRIIWTLRIAISKRMIPISIFACRLLIVPPIALRLWKLKPSNDTSVRPNLMSIVYTQAALHSAFILASSTHIVPFLKPFCEGYYPNTSTFVDASGYDLRSKVVNDLPRVGCIPRESCEGGKSSSRSASATSAPLTRADSAFCPPDPSADINLH